MTVLPPTPAHSAPIEGTESPPQPIVDSLDPPVRRRLSNVPPILDLLNACATIVSALVAIAAFLVILHFRNQLAFPEQVSHLRELYFDVYLDRVIGESAADSLKGTSLKELRYKVRRTWQEGTQVDQRLHMDDFRARTLIRGTWENAFAYDLSLGLERIGTLVFTGILPLELILSLNGYLLLEDWVYCSKLVDERIRREADPVSIQNGIPFARRHGEWLALVAAIYMHDRWRSANQDLFIDSLGGIDRIRQRERQLRRADRTLLAGRTAKALEGILAITK